MSNSENAECPTVDILIRSTGRPELGRALTSLTRQSHTALQVYIADVLSSGLEVPEGLPFLVEIVRGEGRMVRSHAANALLERASSPFALFLDDDDWIEADHIEKLLRRLVQSPAAVLAFSDTRCVRMVENGREVVVREYAEAYSRERLMFENYIPIHAALIRRTEKTRRIKFDSQFDIYEDWDYWIQLQQLGPFEHVPGVSAVYCIHDGAGTGVQIDDPAVAERALQTLIDKWRQRWSLDELQNLWGYGRQVARLDAALQQANIELMRSEETKDLQAQQLAHILNSRSWRWMAPMRGLGQFARALRKQMHLKIVRWLSRWLLNVLTTIYRHDRMQGVARLFPSALKRLVRNQLMYLSHDRLEVQRANPSNIDWQPDGPITVSIVIPVYNHFDYLQRCIDSALKQTYEHIEVVVVDDCSPDVRVQGLLQSYAGNPKVKLLCNEVNCGIAETQNKALIASTGDLIAFLDCDDLITPEAIATCVQHWKSDTVYLHTGRVNIDDKDQEINRIHFMGLPRQDYFAENYRAMYATHLKVIHRRAFAKLGLFDKRFDSAQDYEMLMRIAFHYPSSAFVHIPDFLYYHRLHAAQTSEVQNARQLQLTKQIQTEAKLRQSIRHGDYARSISIVMLSYGKHTQPLQAIEGLQRTVHIPHEVILYDNGSEVETVEFLRTQIEGKFSNVKVIYGDSNLGPAQGRRRALEHASGEWFIIFDNDEIPESGWIEELLLRAETHPYAGAVCCRVVFPNGKLQFSGGKVKQPDPALPYIDLGLHDNGRSYADLETCDFKEVDWCPIGATLFTVNIAPYLHDGYPNTFEDAGVSFALKKAGYQLLNAPGALVWHEHVSFRPKVDMGKKYMADRYNPKMMLKSVASFYAENGLIIKDEYIWRENRLNSLDQRQLTELLNQMRHVPTAFH